MTEELEYQEFVRQCRKAHKAILNFWEWKFIGDTLRKLVNEWGLNNRGLER